MMITKHPVAEKIASYLGHDISLEELVSWAEGEIMDGESTKTRRPRFP